MVTGVLQRSLQEKEEKEAKVARSAPERTNALPRADQPRPVFR